MGTKALLRGFAAAAVAAAALAAPTAATADNVVVATNTRDATTVFRVSVAIRRAPGDVVDDANVAVAAGSCSSCRTVAIALETVLAFGDPSVWTPTNMAIAINVDCANCETFAAAYQWAIQTGRPVHFTAAGNRRIAQIRRELLALRRADLSIWELVAAVQQVADELADVLSTQLAPAGRA